MERNGGILDEIGKLFHPSFHIHPRFWVQIKQEQVRRYCSAFAESRPPSAGPIFSGPPEPFERICGARTRARTRACHVETHLDAGSAIVSTNAQLPASSFTRSGTISALSIQPLRVE